MKPGWLIALGFAAGIAVFALGLRLRSVTADVPPPAERMFYAGELREGAGPATGPRDIEIRFHSTATGSSNQICTSGLQANTPLVDGHFRINVGSTCVTMLAAAQNAYVEVVVGGVSLPPSTIPRPRVAAVPYAVQAATAVTLTSPLPATAVTTSAGPTVEARLNAIEASLASAFCGATTMTYTGAAVGGYAGAKAKCQARCASTTAHLCRPDELVRTEENGIAVPVGVYNSGVSVPGGMYLANDCYGWTRDTGTFVAPYWAGAEHAPSYDSCSSAHALLCCDAP